MAEPRRTLQGRLHLLVGLVLIVLVSVTLVFVVVVQSFQHDARRREEIIPAAADASELSGILVDQLDVLASERPTSRATADDYPSARLRATVLLGRLEIELADRGLDEELDALRVALVAWQDQVTDIANRTGRAVGDIPAGELSDVQDRLTVLASRAEGLTHGVTQAVADAADDAESSRALLLWSIVGTAVLVVALLIVGFVQLRKWVVVPVQRLTGEVARVAEGTYDVDLPTEATEELAVLADSVGRMRDRILSARARADRAAKAVEQQAPAVNALRTLLAPRLADPPAGAAVAGALLPADGELAGDWFDVAAGESTLIVAMGDVCGHGVEAGVLAVRTKFALLDAIDLHLDPARALALAAKRFVRDDTFATAIVAEIDPRRRECRYASAGHNPGLLLHADGTHEELGRTGPLIGLANGPRPNAYIRIVPGDLLVLYTDGVVEARNAEGVMLDRDGLLELLVTHQAETPQLITEAVMARVRAHADGATADDATIVVVRIDQATSNEVCAPRTVGRRAEP